jgi:argininosuccinate lyase
MPESRRTLWGARTGVPLSQSVLEYTRSVDVDLRLLPDDVDASLAHAAMLQRAGLISADDQRAIASGLQRLRSEYEKGELVVAAGDEDVHSVVERRLHELVGEPALRLHSGRSRNDQVATDLRLYARRRGRQVLGAIAELQDVLRARGEQHARSVMPGYTHLQRAQPVSLRRHLGAYVEMLERDAGRISDALRRADVLPLGSAALAGSTLPLDPGFVAEQLGFAATSRNPMDAVSDRDFAAEIVFSCALLMVHCSRLCEDMVLWCSSEFSFMSFDNAHATGSSLMPQKKNPDVAELARGRSARVIGDVVSLLTMLKGLPLAYDRDLQEDKRPLYDGLDTAQETLVILTEVLRAARFDTERMRAAASDPALLATDVAEALVRRGVAFRQAHEIVATMVRRSSAEGRSLAEVRAAEWDEVSPGSGAELVALFDVDAALARREADVS